MNSELWPLFAALAIAWLGLACYVTWMVRRQEHLRQEIATLRAILDSRQAHPVTDAQRRACDSHRLPS